MQARFYLPWFGRFASPDPALDQHFEHTQSWNIYSYVRNQPTMQIDPDGQVVVVPTIVGIFIVKALVYTGATVAGIWVGHKIHQEIKKHQEAEAAPTSTGTPTYPVGDVLKDAKAGDGKGGKEKVGSPDKPVDQWVKPGGMDQADKDFDKIAKPDSVVDKGGGIRVGDAVGEPEGTKVVVRPKSSKDPKTGKPGPPTVEVQRPAPKDGPKPPDTKIRYPEKVG